jgi:hypothetical protein
MLNAFVGLRFVGKNHSLFSHFNHLHVHVAYMAVISVLGGNYMLQDT